VDSRDRNLSRPGDILVGITPRMADPRGSELYVTETDSERANSLLRPEAGLRVLSTF
jgi:hypothetical protein